MREAWRGALSWALVGTLGVLVGLAAWLGVTQSPPRSDTLSRFLAESSSAGTLRFATTIRSAELPTVTEVRGAIDFSDDSGTEVSVVRTIGQPPLWSETVVVHGAGYTRPGSDLGGRRFSEPWSPLTAAMSVLPFEPLAGPAATSPLPPRLLRLASVDMDGSAATEYQLASLVVTCPGAAVGRPRTETTTSAIWVDGQGRIRRFENVTDTRFADALPGQLAELRVTTITTFGDFGAPLDVGVPARVLGGPPTKAPPDPLVGCLVASA